MSPRLYWLRVSSPTNRNEIKQKRGIRGNQCSSRSEMLLMLGSLKNAILVQLTATDRSYGVPSFVLESTFNILFDRIEEIEKEK